MILSSEHAHAFDLDMTVDDDIRKNYNYMEELNDIFKYSI